MTIKKTISCILVASSMAMAADNTATGAGDDVIRQIESIQSELKSGSVTGLETKKSSTSKAGTDDIDSLINMLESLHIPGQSASQSSDAGSKTAAPEKTAADADKAGTGSAPKKAAQPAAAEKTSADKAAAAKVSEKADPQKDTLPENDPAAQRLAALEKIIAAAEADTNSIVNPAGLAHATYLCGKPEKALNFYKIALDKLNPRSKEYDREKAWTLFQMGNCMKEIDPGTARAIYSQLIDEYPKTDWAQVARMQISIIEWKISTKPRKLLEAEIK